MNDIDKILLNQASMMRCLWLIMEAIAREHGFAESEAHKNLVTKLKNAAQEAEEYATRNEYRH